MFRVPPVLVLLTLLIALAVPSSARAQAVAQRGRLIVTVSDPSGGFIPGASVNVIGVDDATKAVTVPSQKTGANGIVTFDGLVLGRYSIQAEFSGFNMGLLRDVRVSRGDNKHVVVLPLAHMSESIDVGPGGQALATDRASAFGTALTREQIDALSDDPTEMQQQLNDMAGPGAVIRVDSFEGQNLPPKSQIKAIHITRDQFAAENHSAGGLFIDIITQPGIGPLHAGVRLGFYDSAMDGTNPLIQKKGPAQSQNYGFNVSRSLLKDRSDFSLNISGTNAFQTPNLYVTTLTGRQSQNLGLRQPNDNLFVSGTFNYALTKDQTLRVSVTRSAFTSDNQGVGQYDFLERAYSTFSHNTSARIQEAGPLGRRFFTNTRFTTTWSETGTHSAVETPTVIVNEQFTSGGAQRAGGRRTRTFTLASDLDYVRGINSVRAGVQIDGGYYHSDDTSNYLGTFTFDNLDTFAAGQPRSYTRRTGDPLITYWNVQAGMYLQDDVRISKSLTLTPGIRYEAQTHVKDRDAFAPRIGITWAPFKSGKTTIRASWGLFNDWLSTGIYEQTLRVDGVHQQEINLINPSYPDPGSVGAAPPTNRYLIDPSIPMIRNNRTSAGFSQIVSQKVLNINFGATYAFVRGTGLLVGENLNAPVQGVRPNPAFANLIEAVADGRSRQQTLSINGSISAAPGPNLTGPRFKWNRGLGVFASYTLGKSENNTDGAFGVPASANLGSEWGPSGGDVRHRANVSINTGALKNFNAGIGITAGSAPPITIRTGHDDNGDLIFNDRPAGVGRNTARVSGQFSSYGFFAYTFGLGKQQGTTQPGVMITSRDGTMAGLQVTTMAAQAAPKYRLSLQATIDNLTNHPNYTGYGSIIGSDNFLKPTQVQGVRRVTINLGLNF